MEAKDLYQNASEIRKNWSITIDSVVHNRPAFINRTHDYVTMMSSGMVADLLRDYKYHLTLENEPDGSVTGYVAELELVENAPTKNACLSNIIEAMKDYALDYYQEFNYWSKAPNRASHLPYIIKLLISDDQMIMEDLVCLDGKN